LCCLVIVATIKVIAKIIKAHRRPAFTGAEEITGSTAVVKKILNPGGIVLFRGENWTAISESGTIEQNEEVTITRYDGLRLWVTKINKGGS
jgi:membrane-bound ClpP family serine protease